MCGLKSSKASKPTSTVQRVAIALWHETQRASHNARLRSKPAIWRYGGSHAADFYPAPQPIRPAHGEQAAAFYAGRFALDGYQIDTRGNSPFLLEVAPEPWVRALHSFRWLRHLHAADSELARQLARSLVEERNALFANRYGHLAWDTDIASNRLMSFLTHAGVVLQGPGFEDETVSRLIARHVGFLRAALKVKWPDAAQAKAAIALTFATQLVESRARNTTSAVRDLEIVLTRQILADGGHLNRNPSTVLDLLMDCIVLKEAFAGRGAPTPPCLVAAIDRMGTHIATLSHTDGQLMQANGAREEEIGLLKRMMSRLPAQPSALIHSLPSEYHRLAAGGSIVLMDIGTLPAPRQRAPHHAGCLGFEFSTDGQRVFTHCGVPRSPLKHFDEDNLQEAGTMTAAHCALTAAGQSNATKALALWLRHWTQGRLLSGPQTVEIQHGIASDGRHWINANHDGYLKSFGLLHRRAISLSDDGMVLEGEDELTLKQSAERRDVNFQIRFHLMPGLKTSPLAGSNTILITGPREFAWEMEVVGADIAAEDSLYMAAFAGPKPSHQIILNGRFPDASRIEWRLEAVKSKSGNTKSSASKASTKCLKQGEREI